ncbi:hypothetical protein [Embleya sp. NPDC020630]|uniref:hypothetical protein n=1 Tax=Embleya sp. NPDC020630 TaxID=3363979 RepID=UPI003793152C
MDGDLAAGASWVHGCEGLRGTERDVRVVVAGMPVGVREGLVYERVPWDRFAHAYGSAADVPELLEGLRSGDAAVAADCLSSLAGSVCHQGTRYAPAALAVPFLLRIAADRTTHPRVGVLFLAAGAARDGYGGAAPRAGLLRVGGDHMRFDTGAYREDWTVRAARAAIAADAHIPIALLDDSDPEVRMGAAHVLSTAAHSAERISVALHERLRGEGAPQVRAGLVLAIAQLAHQHRHEDAAALTHAHWANPAHPLVVRASAALAWLGLVDDPAPDDLRTILEAISADELDRLAGELPWLWSLAHHGGVGAKAVLRRMLDPNIPATADDPPVREQGCADDPPFQAVYRK